jgi:precorrin-6A/cobalt-precorrin-6A reductase
MPNKHILILAGTHEARLLANRLVEEGHNIVSSFAGVTQHPALPKGHIRKGGFGGVAGLKAYLEEQKFDVVIDATHPFAAQMSRHVYAAWPQALRLERPAWVQGQGDDWINVASVDEAASVLDSHARILLSIGRKEILPFILRPDLSGVARMIEPPEQGLPRGWQLVLQRPPFTVEAECALLVAEKMTHVVCKNSGGADTAAKLEAARKLGLKVIMVAAIAGHITSR